VFPVRYELKIYVLQAFRRNTNVLVRFVHHGQSSFYKFVLVAVPSHGVLTPARNAHPIRRL
jgi:hypothetical protein